MRWAVSFTIGTSLLLLTGGIPTQASDHTCPVGYTLLDQPIALLDNAHGLDNLSIAEGEKQHYCIILPVATDLLKVRTTDRTQGQCGNEAITVLPPNGTGLQTQMSVGLTTGVNVTASQSTPTKLPADVYLVEVLGGHPTNAACGTQSTYMLSWQGVSFASLPPPPPPPPPATSTCQPSDTYITTPAPPGSRGYVADNQTVSMDQKKYYCIPVQRTDATLLTVHTTDRTGNAQCSHLIYTVIPPPSSNLQPKSLEVYFGGTIRFGQPLPSEIPTAGQYRVEVQGLETGPTCGGTSTFIIGWDTFP